MDNYRNIRSKLRIKFLSYKLEIPLTSDNEIIIIIIIIIDA